MDLLTEDYQQLLSKIDEILRYDFKLGIELIKSQNIDIKEFAKYIVSINDIKNFDPSLRIQYSIYQDLYKYNWDDYINPYINNGYIKLSNDTPDSYVKTLELILNFSINE